MPSTPKYRTRVKDFKARLRSKKYYENNRDRCNFQTVLAKADKKYRIAGRPRPKVCEECGKPPRKGGYISFDHCHQSGKFRGWLCTRCNTILGLAGDDPEVLQKLADYLRRHGAIPTTEQPCSCREAEQLTLL